MERALGNDNEQTMKKYIKNYHEANGLDLGDWIACEVCGQTAVDIHHIRPKGRGGGDEAENLIALCRKHHRAAHFQEKPYITEEQLLNYKKNV